MDRLPLPSADSPEPPAGDGPGSGGRRISGAGLGLEEFRARIARRKDPHHRVPRPRSRGPVTAGDRLQDTFTTLWVKRAQYRGEGSLEGYLRRIAYRTFLNERKRTARERAQPALDHDPWGREPVPDDEVAVLDERKERRRRLRAVVEGLPDAWRVPFVLFRFEELSCAEVGDLLGLSPKAVEGRLARAILVVAARYREAEAAAAIGARGAGR